MEEGVDCRWPMQPTLKECFRKLWNNFLFKFAIANKKFNTIIKILKNRRLWSTSYILETQLLYFLQRFSFFTEKTFLTPAWFTSQKLWFLWKVYNPSKLYQHFSTILLQCRLWIIPKYISQLVFNNWPVI